MAIETFQLDTGERRDANHSSRVWFVYLTPTNAELPLSKCPSIKRKHAFASGGFEGTSRFLTTEYIIDGPTTLAMISVSTSLGKPAERARVILELDPGVEPIMFGGLSGFGGFRGRGRVDYDRSSYQSGRAPGGIGLNLDFMKRKFGLKVIHAPKKGTAGTKAVRSLMV